MNIEELRKIILKDAGEFASGYVQVAMGRGVMTCTDTKIRDEMWDLVKALILQADDPVKLKGLGEGTIAEQVDCVLLNVADGSIGIKQGKRLIEMLQAGFDITELPKLLQALDGMEKK